MLVENVLKGIHFSKWRGRVTMFFASQHVIACATINKIVAFAAPYHIITIFTKYSVASAIAFNSIVATAGKYHIITGPQLPWKLVRD